MTDHWQVIEGCLEGEISKLTTESTWWEDGSGMQKRILADLKELDAAIAFVREQQAQPMTDGLLPCPFCGSKAELQWESSQGVVSCTNEECYATSTWFSSDNASEVREYVTAKWNRRVPTAPQAATVQGQPKLREVLAEYAHDAWSGWMKYLFSKCDTRIGYFSNGEVICIPAWAVDRWQRQMNTPYADLPEQEKQSDREEADKMLAIMTQRPRPADDA